MRALAHRWEFTFTRLLPTEDQPRVAMFDVTLTLQLFDGESKFFFTDCVLSRTSGDFTVTLPDKEAPDQTSTASSQLSHYFSPSVMNAIRDTAAGMFLTYENQALYEQKTNGTWFRP